MTGLRCDPLLLLRVPVSGVWHCARSRSYLRQLFVRDAAGHALVPQISNWSPALSFLAALHLPINWPRARIPPGAHASLPIEGPVVCSLDEHRPLIHTPHGSVSGHDCQCGLHVQHHQPRLLHPAVATLQRFCSTSARDVVPNAPAAVRACEHLQRGCGSPGARARQLVRLRRRPRFRLYLCGLLRSRRACGERHVRAYS